MKLIEAQTKTNDALSKFAGDPSAAASDLSGARGEIDSAESEGLPSADANLLRQMIDDLIDVINNGGDPINGGGGSPLCDNGITHTRSAGLISPNANQCSDIFFFSYDKWYEGREQRYVDIIDIDVTALYAWIGMGVSRQTGTMYITIDGTNPALDPNGDGTYPVIRLINATSLSAPITFATNHPIYVQGHYNNNAAWYPSALVGDAVTFLSTPRSHHFSFSPIRNLQLRLGQLPAQGGGSPRGKRCFWRHVGRHKTHGHTHAPRRPRQRGTAPGDRGVNVQEV